MQMIKKIVLVIFVTICSLVHAQQNGNPSPYSFYGIGTQQFRGTSENRMMGGISVFSDSLHLNLRNPASLGKLRYVTFAIGAAHDAIDLEDNNLSSATTNTALNYIALGFPVSKQVGVSFGLVPFTSVGYQIDRTTDEALDQFTGSGGLNRVFLSAGYKPIPGLTVGLSAEYNFGNIQNEIVQFQNDIELGIRETNRSDLLGFSYNIGAQYETKINEKLDIHASASYIPSSSITAENTRNIASVTLNNLIGVTVEDEIDVTVPESDFEFPSVVTLGVGVGEKNKWFFGGEYTSQSNGTFNNRSFTLDNASFEDATQIRFGGFYTPNYVSIRSYLDRITYRAGFRYEELGLVISNEAINEFGISFGVGLPTRGILSNLNVGFEYGQRGTTNANLVEETIFNFNISISFNDIWFLKSKFN